MKWRAEIGWLVGLAVAVAVSWAIWRYAPIADQQLRFIAALAPFVLLWLLPVLFGRRFGRMDARVDMPGLRAQRKAVLAFLAKRGLAGRRARLAVPLYLVVGARGSGKSSLLDRSGLDLGNPASIAGATWWAGEKAIFVEIPLGAPYESPRQICELVRSLRPSLPANGIVLVISPADLTLADQAEHREFAEAVSQGLREIGAVTRQDAPLYMLLAKVDLLPGFQEFFDRQEPQERLQPWGFMLPLPARSGSAPAASAGEAVAEGFQSLLATMRVRLVEWLSREADPVRCARINGFGAQIAGLQTTIKPVLDALSSGGAKGRMVALRGIFMTSARQEALSIDGLLPELSRRFAMPRVGLLPPDLGLDDEDHGYFINGTFKDAIFREAGLVAGGKARAGVAARWAAVAVLAALCVGIGYLVLETFSAEIRHASHAADVASTLHPLSSPITVAALPSLLGTMQQLDDLDTRMQRRAPVPPIAVGLSGRPRLEAAVDSTRALYRRNALLPSLAARLETELVDLNAAVATLKARLDLAGASGNPDSAAMTSWLEEEARSLPEADRAFFVSESKAALRAAGGMTIDPAYIDAARRIIAYKESLS